MLDRLVEEPTIVVLDLSPNPRSQLSPEFSGAVLPRIATFFSRLARPDTLQRQSVLFDSGRAPLLMPSQSTPSRTFSDYPQRYIENTFILRFQVSFPSSPSVKRSRRSVRYAHFSPSEAGAGSHLARDRITSAYEIRIPASTEEEQLARWNLEGVDFIGLPGKAESGPRPILLGPAAGTLRTRGRQGCKFGVPPTCCC